MKQKKLRFGEGFRVMRGNRASQAEPLSSFSDAKSTR
jgi:hypothetical protein